MCPHEVSATNKRPVRLLARCAETTLTLCGPNLCPSFLIRNPQTNCPRPNRITQILGRRRRKRHERNVHTVNKVSSEFTALAARGKSGCVSSVRHNVCIGGAATLTTLTYKARRMLVNGAVNVHSSISSASITSTLCTTDVADGAQKKPFTATLITKPTRKEGSQKPARL